MPRAVAPIPKEEGGNAKPGSGARLRFAIYDLDRTITRAATWTRFLLFAIRTRALWRGIFVPLALGAGLANVFGLIDRRSLKQVMHRMALGRLTQDEAARLARAFATAFAPRHLRADALARIASDRAAGYRIVIATAAYAFYADALAELVSADALIATRALAADDRLLPLIDGDNLYGAAKLEAIEGWLRETGVERGRAHIRFYSDHVSDVPTLAWADEPFAVSPAADLRAIATERGWSIFDWD